MNYKKLNEVDVIESMSDSGFVLGVDESGGVKRVPKSTMGKIKTINGAEPDENGNIEVVGGNENLAGVGVTEFVQSVVEMPDSMTVTINIRAGEEAGTYHGGWIFFDEYALVNFDGTDYTCKVSKEDLPMDSAVAWFGNYSLYDSMKEDTGEPFFVVSWNDMYPTRWWVADNSVEHTAICRTGKFVTGVIPEEYLPFKQPTITALTIPYVVETGDNSDSRDNAKIGGYTFNQVKELMSNGCSVSFLQTYEIVGDEYDPPLLYTLSGGIYDDAGSYRYTEGFVFTALKCGFMIMDGTISDLETSDSYHAPAIVGFWWNGKEVKPFTQNLMLPENS